MARSKRLIRMYYTIGGTVGNIYMKAQLSVKRELSKAKAPVMAHFGAAIEGISEFPLNPLNHHKTGYLNGAQK